MLIKMGTSFPQVLVKIKRYLKPPPRKLCCFIFFKYVLIVFGWVGLNFFIQRNCHIYLENGRSKFKSNSICSEQKPWKLKSSKTQKHLEEIESLHPPKTNMEPENGWFGVDDLPFPGENTLRFQPFIFPGVILIPHPIGDIFQLWRYGTSHPIKYQTNIVNGGFNLKGAKKGDHSIIPKVLISSWWFQPI